MKMEKESTILDNYTQSLFNSLNDGIIVFWANGKIKFANEAACNFLGYKQEEVINLPIRTIIENWEFILEQLRLCDLSGTVKKLNIKNCYITNEGIRVPNVTSAMVLHINGDETNEIVCVLKNNTDNYQNHEQLKIDETYFEELFKKVQMAMALIDNDGNVVNLNNEFTKLFGYLNIEAKGNPIQELIAPENMQNEIIANTKRVLDGQSLISQTVGRHKGGALIDVMVVSGPVIINNKQVGAYVVFRDIAERKKTQRELEKANKELKDATAKLVQTERINALGELSASIAHELNQPLNNMKIVCQDIMRDIAKDRLEIETVPESIQDVAEQIDRMTEIINHMRIFTRPFDNDMNKEYIDVNKPIRNIFLLMGEQLRVNNIEVIRDSRDNLPLVFANIIALEQVFTNILINARHAIEDFNQKDKKIEITSFMNSENEVAVSISNNGGKIPKDIRERIFEPFFTTKDPGKGTGLGLSISKKIIEEHNGRIMLEEQGNWTKFTIILPIIDERRV